MKFNKKKYSRRELIIGDQKYLMTHHSRIRCKERFGSGFSDRAFLEIFYYGDSRADGYKPIWKTDKYKPNTFRLVTIIFDRDQKVDRIIS